MPTLEQPAVEKLREYLRDLKPAARALLMGELERTLLRGDDLAGAEVILAELRRELRDGVSDAERVGEAARRFFKPLEPFLVDDAPNHKHRGRIARRTLEPLWSWVSTSVMEEDAQAYTAGVEAAMLGGKTEELDLLVRAFQDRAVQAMQKALAKMARDEKERRRLTGQLGTTRALEDVQVLISILNSRDALAQLASHMPPHIKSLSHGALESTKTLMDATLTSRSDMFVYALILVMSRLSAPWQLIRLAIRSAGTDVASRIADTPYALAVTIVMTEIERLARELTTDLKSGRDVAVAALLKNVHDAMRGVRSEMNLSGDTPWARQLAHLRAEVSDLLTSEINLIPGRVRRLVRPRPMKDITPGSVLDEDDVKETEALLGFAAVCRTYAGELAINEVTQRVFHDLHQMLDTGTRSLIDSLRSSGDAEKPFRQSQADAAVRFCAKVFGDDYAATLHKAADVAGHGHGHAAPKAVKA